MKTPIITLVNAEERTSQYGEKFKIPTSRQRHDLKPGDYVKLIFNDTERMWVSIRRVLPGGNYEGILASKPIVVTELSEGDPIIFMPAHICDIVKAGGEITRTKMKKK